MDFINSHPGIVYAAIALVQLIALLVITSALVSIAISLRNKKEK